MQNTVNHFSKMMNHCSMYLNFLSPNIIKIPTIQIFIRRKNCRIQPLTTPDKFSRKFFERETRGVYDKGLSSTIVNRR